MMNSDRLWYFLRIFVGLILAYAGFIKLLEPSANFEASLLKYGVFSPKWIPWIAQIVPWMEWLLGCLLIVGYAPRLVALGTSILTFSFLVALASSRLLLEAGNSDCGCFGHTGLHLTMRQIFLVDLLSLGISLRVSFLKKFPLTLHSFLLKRKEELDDRYKRKEST